MPRFHFNVYDGSGRLDEEGSDCLNYNSARIAAVRLAGEIIRDTAEQMLARDDWRLEVTDDRGLVLFCLDLCLTDSAAVTPYKPA